MKCLQLLIFTVSTLFSVAFIEGNTFLVDAQEIANSFDNPRITNALSYPTSSQRFFQEGRDLLEIEIQRLQQNSPTSRAILCIDPEILPQKRDRQKQKQTGGQPCCHKLKLQVNQSACY
ncbi:hypothetical protein [Calothrix sp. PCC 7507]|uniref:hypothetical protein n=1 Tax=Calothrix sp. PCC 7507 TaxID=99598 RepID=UPI00029EF64D|nr:hypothetical protein [Calothrix sp. PCC 7507]AFY32173.1 hypothetical protein Cal7507_1716 [Calothrix sp. PCC 7507]